MKEKLMELLEEAPGQANNEVYSFAEIADHLIANGATIPVRCKECKHSFRYSNVYPRDIGCLYLNTNYDIEPEHFCSKGERRTNE